MKFNYTKKPLNYIKILIKWLLISSLVGTVGGGLGSVFHIAIDYATELRGHNPQIIYLLPIGGLFIVFMYRLYRPGGALDTNRVLLAASGKEKVPLIMAPFITVSTVITHLLGGSAGREGAALQLGGSLGYNIGRIFKLDSFDLHIITMSGMSAVFAALFGTPITAAVFAIEVCLIGDMHYEALVPSVISAFVASIIAKLIGLHPVSFELAYRFAPSFPEAGRILLLAIACAMAAMLFCHSIHKCEHIFAKLMPSPYIRAMVGGALIALFTYLLNTYDYNGAGMDVIGRAIDGNARPEAFIIKIIFTAITISAGFKGGEIVPAFFVGSVFGAVFGDIIGLDPSFAAAIGFVCVFCSVVNCPLASIILSIEVFGADNLLVFALCCAISYMMSGHSSLYSVQQFRYSKLCMENIMEEKENAYEKIDI